MTQLAPVALFVFNRPDHTQLTLESLAANAGIEDTPVFVFCDGARNSEEVSAVEETRQVVKDFKLPNVQIIERPHNFGCARSIVTGVEELLAKYGRVIVVEDDYYLSPYFLDFMNRALDKYASDERVMHVSAYQFPTETALPETFFTRPIFGACWGWGTWARAWKHFEPDPRRLIARLNDPEVRHEFCLRGATRYYQRLFALAAGKIDVWEVLWYASIFLRDGLCLRPSRSLLFNLGNDGTGVNCVDSRTFDVVVHEEPILHFPEEVKEDETALQAAIAFHQSLREEAFVTQIAQRFGGRNLHG